MPSALHSPAPPPPRRDRPAAGPRPVRLALATAILLAALPLTLASGAAARPAGRHALTASVRAARAAPRLGWSAPEALAPRASGGEASAIAGIACPSRGHCAAADRNGVVFTTSSPTRGPSRWHPTRLATAPRLVAIACPSLGLCVAASHDGRLFSSSQPFGAHPVWSAATLPGVGLLTGVSCASISLCVVVGDAGDASVSRQPTSGTSWSTAQIDSGTYACSGSRCQAGLTSVSCPTAAACLAFDDAGTLLRSTSPAGGSGAWDAVSIVGRNAPHGSVPSGCLSGYCVALSCPSASACVAVDTGAQVLTSPEPFGSSTAWAIHSLGALGSPSAIACASPSACVVADSAGEILASGEPAGGPAAWVPARVEPRRAFAQLTSLSCPSASECLAGDSAGRLFVGVSGGRAGRRLH